MMLQGNVENGEEHVPSLLYKYVFSSQILYSLEEICRKAMDTLNDLADDFIIDGKDTQPNVINQNIAYSTGEGMLWVIYLLSYNALFSFVPCHGPFVGKILILLVEL